MLCLSSIICTIRGTELLLPGPQLALLMAVPVCPDVSKHHTAQIARYALIASSMSMHLTTSDHAKICIRLVCCSSRTLLRHFVVRMPHCSVMGLAQLTPITVLSLLHCTFAPDQNTTLLVRRSCHSCMDCLRRQCKHNLGPSCTASDACAVAAGVAVQQCTQ